MQDFRSLKVWQRSHALILDLYRVTKTYPRDEASGLTSQSRRAAVSIGANLAEACGRRGERERRQFVVVAMGSAYELEYLILLAADLEYLSRDVFQTVQRSMIEVKRMLGGLLTRMRMS